jgi:hypothetical protein
MAERLLYGEHNQFHNERATNKTAANAIALNSRMASQRVKKRMGAGAGDHALG